MGRIGGKLLIFLILLMLSLQLVSAEDQVVINSKNWQDVYSGLIYGKLQNLDVRYVPEETIGLQLISKRLIDRNKKDVLLIESGDEPFIYGYSNKLSSEAGFNVEKITSKRAKDTNVLLAERLISTRGLSKFIVIDGDLGYSAISVASYAIINDAFVLFVDKENVADAYNFLQSNAEEIILYGRVDREVKDRLSDLNPIVINTGDRYSDNLEIVKKFIEQSNAKQIIMTNGELIEHSFFSNEFPNLLIGTNNIPQQTIDYLLESSVTTGVVVGYDLYSNARRIKDLTGIKIYLKYGQGWESNMYALDVFPIPKYSPNVNISSVYYNVNTKQLEISYKNEGEIFAFVQGLSHKIILDGETIAQVGDEIAFFLDGEETKTIAYDLDLIDYTNKELYLESDIIFGDSASSLDRSLFYRGKIEFIEVNDDSKIDVLSLVYDKRTKRFEIEIKNVGSVDVYADPEIRDLIIADEKQTLGSEQDKLNIGETKTFMIKALLEEVDFLDNPKINVYTRYGARESALIKFTIDEFDMNIKSSFGINKVLIVVVIIIIIWFLLKRRKKDEEDYEN